MAQKKDKYTKKFAKIRRRRTARFVFSMILLVIVTVVGSTLLAVLWHFTRIGDIGSLGEFLKGILESQELDVTFTVFWMIPVPFVLAIVLVISIIRRRRFKHFRYTWEQTARIAVEEERKAYEAKMEKLAHTRRFSTLNGITSPTIPETGDVQSLKQLCESFRMFAASQLNLYYTDKLIREFIAGLAVSHILILQGMSGTGKTSLVYAFGQYLQNPSSIIPVQPTWKERFDLLGYFNEFTKKYNETPLLKKIYEANGSNQIYITVLDEMNVARVEYYFAEFLSLLEIPNPELRYLEVVPDVWEDDPPQLKNGRIKLPENMWFVGTANNDDSTFAISDKVYDRAMIIDLEKGAIPFTPDENVSRLHITYNEFVRLADNAQRGYQLTRRNERRLRELDEHLISKYQITYGNRIMRQLRSYVSVYVSCGGDELDALDDIICKKVLRKLSYKDMSQIRKDLKATSKYLEKLFGTDKMPVCREFLAQLSRN